MATEVHKIRVTHAARLSTDITRSATRVRWQITLACGHASVVTSATKPVQAHCRTCAKATA